MPGRDEFLRDYWQKKPLLMRQAFPDFEPELDADDIAGLACEEHVEARLVSGSYPAHDWTLHYGPFSERTLRALPGRDWTLLVQDVEKHYPPLQGLLSRFDFLPRWRIDDLMVSVAAPGGSVGPHTDQYDVFLLQAEGRRSWRITREYDPALQAGTELNVLRSFEATDEWVLEPGDVLYLPPGVAHHGVALDRCMTWSLGMRAPSAADLLQALGEWLADARDEGPRYADPDLAAAEQVGRIDAAALQRFGALATGVIESEDDFGEFIGRFLSRYRLAQEPAGPPQPVDEIMLTRTLAGGRRLRQNPWTRLLWLAEGDGARLFAAGSAHRCTRRFAATVCDPRGLETGGADLAASDAPLLCELINAGHLYVEAEE